MLHEDRRPKVSIIIPCYNHGKYIEETLQSIDRITDKNIYEVIIVNDGSTDEYTNTRLKEFSKTGLYKIIFQENQGVCVAKNTAIANARGEYILPVDADNLLRPEFIDEGLKIFEKNENIAVVYSDYHLFGDKEGVNVSGPFNLQKLMLYNFIENCSIYKKTMINEIGGYDVFLTRIGVEDWELWLRAAFKGYQFHYINQPLFDYRVLATSRQRNLNASKKKANTYTDYFIEKFAGYYGLNYVDDYFLGKFKPNFMGFLYKIILRLFYPKKFWSLVEKGKFRKYL
jgi:glycosyltransferase involved in cell wall biosynthesis